MGKKSTAQPRPQLHVPPRGIGPIQVPNVNDVLCGRGGRINAHEGNVQFRDLVNANKKVYLAKTTKKLEKAHIAAGLVEHTRSMNPPGRFLREDSDTGFWYDIGDAKAIKKAGQALREDAPDIREDDSDDDGTSPKADRSKRKSKSPSRTAQPPTALNDNRANFNWPTAGVSTNGQGQPQSPFPAQTRMLPFTGSPSPYSGMAVQMAPVGVYPPQDLHNIAYRAPLLHQMPSGQSPALYNVPRQMYEGVRSVAKGTGTVSNIALEALNTGHEPTNRNRPQFDQNMAFGRTFTPTALSSGGSDAMSIVSGLSSDSRLINKSELSALSMGSNLTNRPIPAYHGGIVGQYRPGHFAGGDQQGTGGQVSGGDSICANQLRGSGVSDLTYSFMQFSGMTRSPSFGDMSTRGSDTAYSTRSDIPMSDASLVALLSEESEVGAIFSDKQREWDHTRTIPEFMPTLNSSETSSTTIGSRDVTGRRNQLFSTNFMSFGSNGSNTSWLLPYNDKIAGSVACENNSWNDER